MDLLIRLTKLIFRHAFPRFSPNPSNGFDQRIQCGLRLVRCFSHSEISIAKYSSIGSANTRLRRAQRQTPLVTEVHQAKKFRDNPPPFLSTFVDLTLARSLSLLLV